MSLKLKDRKFVNANIILRLLQLFCTLNRKAPHCAQTSFNQKHTVLLFLHYRRSRAAEMHHMTNNILDLWVSIPARGSDWCVIPIDSVI